MLTITAPTDISLFEMANSIFSLMDFPNNIIIADDDGAEGSIDYVIKTFYYHDEASPSDNSTSCDISLSRKGDCIEVDCDMPIYNLFDIVNIFISSRSAEHGKLVKTETPTSKPCGLRTA
jgi:P pilus assembly chaperone PapD